MRAVRSRMERFSSPWFSIPLVIFPPSQNCLKNISNLNEAPDSNSSITSNKQQSVHECVHDLARAVAQRPLPVTCVVFFLRAVAEVCSLCGFYDDIICFMLAA